MFSHTIAALEKFDNQHEFERMCADILVALGYEEVVLIAPRGGSDGGMDITFRNQRGERGLACVTLRGDIEKKFFEDFSKRQAGDFEKYIFFCTAYLTAQQKVKFAKYILQELDAEFEPCDVERLRSLLDSALLSIRERYLGIKNDQRAQIESLFAQTREDLQKENQALLLLDKAHDTEDLVQADALVKQAEVLLPSIRQKEYRLLGIRNAHIVIHGLPLEFTDAYGRRHRVYTKDDLAPFLHNALIYLEETVSPAETQDAEGLLYLGCLYGYQMQFRQMLATLKKALTIDIGIQEELCQPPNLRMLLMACESDQNKIDQIMGLLNLPRITQNIFCNVINDFDLTRSDFIQWIAIKRANKPGEKGVHIIRVCPPYAHNGGLVYGHAQAFETGHVTPITIAPQFVPAETFYEILICSFILVSQLDS